MKFQTCNQTNSEGKSRGYSVLIPSRLELNLNGRYSKTKKLPPYRFLGYRILDKRKFLEIINRIPGVVN